MIAGDSLRLPVRAPGSGLGSVSSGALVPYSTAPEPMWNLAATVDIKQDRKLKYSI